MKIPWRTIGHVGAKIVGQVVPAVGFVEQLFSTHLEGSGKDKQTAVVELVQGQLSSALKDVDPLLLFNARVVAAIRAVIDSIVHLQQTIAEELARQGQLPAPTVPATPDR